MRLTPPLGVAPIFAMSINEAQSRSPLIVRVLGSRGVFMGVALAVGWEVNYTAAAHAPQKQR